MLGLLTSCGGGSEPPLVLDSAPAGTGPVGSTPPTTVAAAVPSSVPATVAPTTAPTTPAVVGSTPAPGGAWTDVTAELTGLPTECGTVSFVAGHPDRPTVIAGVARQGLWGDEAEPDAWAQLGTGAGSDQVNNRANSIVFDPDRPDTFWESGSYGSGGVFRTDDAGRTFEQLGDIHHIDALSVDLSDPERRTLLAGSHENREVYRSTDGGRTWNDVSDGLPADIGNASQPLVIDAQVHLIGTNAGAASGIFRTTDGGATWQQVHPTGVYGLPVAAADGAIYWVEQQGAGVVRSVDGGLTWTEVVGPGAVGSAWTLLELPDGRLATVGARNVVVSSDQGASWDAIGPTFPGDPPLGLAYSAARNAFYIWSISCDPTVPAGSIHRLDLTPGGP